MAPQKFVCVNWDPGKTGCKEVGTHVCQNCRLVLYCGADCQKAHLKQHKVDCRSPLSRNSWMPAWYEEGRLPDFVSDVFCNRGVTFFWGNMPAIDILKLSDNEGASFNGKLSLLFAASGDPRNIFKTIAGIPDTRTEPIDITINDKNPAIVARNIIMLLIALVVEDVDEATDCIIHVWYSSFIRKSDLDILQNKVKPLIQNICDKTKGKNPKTLLGKTWIFGSSLFRVVLPKASWDGLLAYFDVPEGITAEDVLEARKASVLHLRDYRDRQLLHDPGHTRVSIMRFVDTGVLLPFGSSPADFAIPNPTLVTDQEAWPKLSEGTPADGWCAEDVFLTACGGATSDSYGKLFYHIREVLSRCHRNITRLGVDFIMIQKDAERLIDELEESSFSRIDVSNIVDEAYLGAPMTLCVMTTLLQLPEDNPHATLITLFMMAVSKTITKSEKLQFVEPGGMYHTWSRSYVLPRQMVNCGAAPTTYRQDETTNHPNLFMFGFTCEALGDYNAVFDRFLLKSMALDQAKLMRMAVKDKHTIVPKWPFKPRIKTGQPGSVEELHRIIAAGRGKQRYVEWKRTGLMPSKEERRKEWELYLGDWSTFSAKDNVW